MYAEAAAGPGTCLDLAAEQGDPFPHAEETEPSRLAVCAGPAVIDHVDDDLVVGVVDGHVGAPTVRVAKCVGESLLDHAVGRQADRGRQRSRVTLDDQIGRQASGLHTLKESRQLAESGLGSHRVFGSHHDEQPSDVVERVAGALSDGGQSLPCGVRNALNEDGSFPFGLNHDQPQGMTDHVVQLSGDPGPLLFHSLVGIVVRKLFSTPEGQTCGTGDQHHQAEHEQRVAHDQPEAARALE